VKGQLALFDMQNRTLGPYLAAIRSAGWPGAPHLQRTSIAGRPAAAVKSPLADKKPLTVHNYTAVKSPSADKNP
jgi:hypothetical protein